MDNVLWIDVQQIYQMFPEKLQSQIVRISNRTGNYVIENILRNV